MKKMVGVDEKIIEIHQGLERGKTKEIAKGAKYVIAEKTSSRMTDKNVKILEKAQARKEMNYKDEGSTKTPFSIFNSFASSFCKCGINMWNCIGKGGEIWIGSYWDFRCLGAGTYNASGSQTEERTWTTKREWETKGEGCSGRWRGTKIKKVKGDNEEDLEGDHVSSSECSSGIRVKKTRVVVCKVRQGKVLGAKNKWRFFFEISWV
jgi:hypothetical protein